MENNNEPKKTNYREFFGRYGVYLILALCITVAAIASLFLFPDNAGDDTTKKDETSKQTERVELSPTSKPVAASNDQRIDDVIDPVTGRAESAHGMPRISDANTTPVPDFSAAPQETGSPTDTLCDPPVQGEVIWDYAMNELIYSVTLDQWTTHCGVDIACRQGDPVRCVAAGTVEKVYTDDAYGVTVVVKHKNGHKTVYSNLAQDETLVKAGVSVSANQIIANCGNTAKFECADKSHIHFEYHVDGKPVNPHKYVRFQSIDH